MAKQKKTPNVEQKVKLVNSEGGITELAIKQANNLFAYQKKHGKKCWEVHKDSEFEYNEKDGFIKKTNSGTTDK